MIYLTISPSQAEPFQKQMQHHEWEMVSQEGGQSQFIGWAYVMHWQKQVDDKMAASCRYLLPVMTSTTDILLSAH